MTANSTASRKAKGRKLQQWVRDKILARFPTLELDDVRSTGMGQGGEDIQLSPKARSLFPYTVECKNCERINVYKFYEQACQHTDKGEPLVVLKSNHKKPLAVVDAEFFLERMKIDE